MSVNEMYIMHRLAQLDYKLKGQLDESNLKRITLDKVNTFIDDRDSEITYSPAAQSSDAAGKWYQYTLDIGPVKNTVTRGKGDVAGTQTATIRFFGSEVSIVGAVGSDGGKFDVTLDGFSEGAVDTYSAYFISGATLWEKTDFGVGEHSLVISMRDDKNASSSDYYLYLDGIRVGPATTLAQLGMRYIGVTYSGTTNGNGYLAIDAGLIAPNGYDALFIVGTVLATLDTLDTLPKVVNSGRYVYLYNGAATTAYTVYVYAAMMDN